VFIRLAKPNEQLCTRGIFVKAMQCIPGRSPRSEDRVLQTQAGRDHDSWVKCATYEEC
jgi:hypothetical protein